MKILIVYDGIIPAHLYGGTQRVIWYLGKELVKLGHDVSYLVAANSTCDFARLIYIDKQRPIVTQITAGFDVVHFHTKYDDLTELDTPYVMTSHAGWRDEGEMDINSIFVSQDHAARFGSNSYVYNGLDWDDYTTPDLNNERSYFHFLGKAAWRIKNVKGAINVIKATRHEQLKVLGGVRFNFNMGIRFTFTRRVSFYGMVGGVEKDRLLNGSKGMIYPVRVPEAFGLALIESLYYGSPIFGTPYGSLPELIHSEVGFLSNKKSELVEAVEHADSYSRKICHDYVVDRFNAKVMALAYLEKYQRVMNQETLNASRPRLVQALGSKYLDWYE